MSSIEHYLLPFGVVDWFPPAKYDGVVILIEVQILEIPSLLADGSTSAGVKRNIFKQKHPETDASSSNTNTSSCC